MNVCGRIANNHGIDAGSVARAQDGAQIARFFDALGDDEEGIFRKLEIGEAEVDLRRYSEKAIGTVSIRDFGKYLARARE